MEMDLVKRIEKLFSDDWEWRMRNNPEYATLYGRNDLSHLMNDRSAERYKLLFKCVRLYLYS